MEKLSEILFMGLKYQFVNCSVFEWIPYTLNHLNALIELSMKVHAKDMIWIKDLFLKVDIMIRSIELISIIRLFKIMDTMNGI